MPRVLLAALATGAAVLAAPAAAAAALTAGDLDPSYGSGGALLDDFFGTQDPDSANAVAVQPDGKIVIAGSTSTGGFGPIALVARYNSNGSRDQTFGPAPHGFVREQVCFSSTCGAAEGDAVATMANGDVVVAGVAVNNATLFVMRLTPTGALDSSFAGAGGNSAGVAAFRLGGVTSGYHVGGVAVQADGAIVLDGTFNSPSQGFIARVPAGGGGLDSAWNSGVGYTTEASGTSLAGLALQPSDGRAVAVGADSTSVLIARFTAGLNAGAQDTNNFHAPFGYTETQLPSGADTAAAVVATSDGRLIVAGTDGTGAGAGIGLFQFQQATGTLDTSFGGGTGQDRVPLPGGDAGTVTGLALDSSGRLVVAGADTTQHDLFVARLTAAGALDPSFGSGGFSIPTIGTSATAQGVSTDAAGDPVVAGFGIPSSASDTDALTARLLASTPTVLPAPAPSLSGVSQARRKWREGSALAHLSAGVRAGSRPPVGTSFRFTLSEAATVTFTFVRSQPGRRVHGKCIAQTHRNRGRPRCTRTQPGGMLAFAGHAGVNRLGFQGRLSPHRKLHLGRYTVTITASAAGKRSAPKSLSFTIVP
jgi:uncharacterized delta-60 repeat protein